MSLNLPATSIAVSRLSRIIEIPVRLIMDKPLLISCLVFSLNDLTEI